ncbi:MAG: hypothetical protein BGN86_09025 [Caulobacterales bacterium 68-7]|mgnify:CR=1 FL=1|nr:hypothetical protein [Caulobacterales bacterium]OJU12227.1 MAG: hypothetical protein BGN86_09025 [Caulobacterales bacterium 68-7]
MTDALSPPLEDPARSTLLVEVIRCWRAACDAGQAVQPRLSALLHRHAGEMMAPVFDSLLSLFEAAIGRRLAVGVAGQVSEDERMVLGLLDGSRPQRACINCTEGAASALNCAVCSTRVMMAMAL